MQRSASPTDEQPWQSQPLSGTVMMP